MGLWKTLGCFSQKKKEVVSDAALINNVNAKRNNNDLTSKFKDDLKDGDNNESSSKESTAYDSEHTAMIDDSFDSNPATPTDFDDIEHATKATNNDLKKEKRKKGKTNGTKEADNDYSLYTEEGVPIYVVKQSRGYLSIAISLIQTGVLTAMMIKCSVAPFSINPMIGPYPDGLSYWGGKNSYDLLYNKEWWRLFSPVLLHAGVFHLMCNVAIQLDSGAFYEKEWGSVVWLVIYLGSTAGGNALSTVINPNTIGVGSSGSVCGLFGAKIAETICRCWQPRRSNYEKVKFGVLMKEFATTMFSVILIFLFSFIPYVDWAAHLGGVLSGFGLGIVIFSCKMKTKRWRILWFMFGITITAMFYGVTFIVMYQESKDDVAEEMNDVCSYYMKIFDDYKCNCMLERYQNGDDEN